MAELASLFFRPIEGGDNLRAFDCGNSALNEYLKRFALRNAALGVAASIIAATPDDPKRVLGYYALTPTDVEVDEVPPDLVRRAGRYAVSGYRLARLAVDVGHHGQGLGRGMVFDAGVRAFKAAQQAGGRLLFIDAKDDTAAAFYRRLGAVSFPRTPLLLAIPLSAFEETYQAMAGHRR